MISPSAEQQIRLDEIRTRLRRYLDGGWTMKPEPDSPAWEGFVPAGRHLYTHAPGDLNYLLTLLASLSQELETVKGDRERVLAAVDEFRKTRGRHDGDHHYNKFTTCSLCEESYVRAEAQLESALVPDDLRPRPENN